MLHPPRHGSEPEVSRHGQSESGMANVCAQPCDATQRCQIDVLRSGYRAALQGSLGLQLQRL